MARKTANRDRKIATNGPALAGSRKTRPRAKDAPTAEGAGTPRPRDDASEAAKADDGRKVVDASGTAIDLSQIRVKIDGVDEAIQALLNERAGLAQLVGISK